jgi:hypothetical protein
VESIAVAATPPGPPQSEDTRDRSRKIFISYAHEDQQFATRLATDLRKKIVRVWIDETGIREGQDWTRQIDAAIRESTEFVVILSPDSRASEIVENELLLAKHLGIPLRPVLYRPCDPWILIGGKQYIDFTEWPEEGLKKLLTDPVPARSLSRRFRILLEKYYRALLAAGALSLSIAASIYSLSPSSTSFTVAGGEPSALLVRIRNEGGRPSMLLASSFKLDFGNLPIEPEPLVLLQPETNTRVAGHADMTLRLTADRMLTPKRRNEESYWNQQDLEPLLKGARVRLTAQVKESDDRLYTRSQDLSADSIKRFILEEFPDDVP